MSQENVELARRLYPDEVELVAIFNDDDALETLLDVLTPMVHSDLETINVRSAIPLVAEGGGMAADARPTSVGVKAFVAAWRDWLAPWETWLSRHSDFIEAPRDRVLVLVEVRARSKRDRVEMSIEGANLLTWREGKLARIEFYFDRKDAFVAAGLSK